MTKTELLSSKLTNKQIAEQLGVSVPTVVRLRKELGIKSQNRGSPKGERPQRRTRLLITCDTCGNEFYMVPSDKDRKYCSRVCMHQSLEYKEKLRNVDRSYLQSDTFRQSRMKDDTPEYRRYANRVHKLSQRIYEQHIDVINPDRHERTLCGVDGGYQLDHIIPVRYGFDNNIPPEELARLDNLRMLPWKQNLIKRDKLED